MSKVKDKSKKGKLEKDISETPKVTDTPAVSPRKSLSKVTDTLIKVITSPEELAQIKELASKYHVVIENNLIKARCPSIDDPLNATCDVSLILTTAYSQAEINIYYQCKKALETMNAYMHKKDTFKDSFLDLDVRGRVMFLEIVQKQDYLKDSILVKITPYAGVGLNMEKVDCNLKPTGSFLTTPTTIGDIFDKYISPSIEPYKVTNTEAFFSTMPEDVSDKEGKKEEREESLEITISQDSGSSSVSSSSSSSSSPSSSSSSSSSPSSSSSTSSDEVPLSGDSGDGFDLICVI